MWLCVGGFKDVVGRGVGGEGDDGSSLNKKPFLIL